jgi:hypothetical protein
MLEDRNPDTAAVKLEMDGAEKPRDAPGPAQMPQHPRRVVDLIQAAALASWKAARGVDVRFGVVYVLEYVSDVLR